MQGLKEKALKRATELLADGTVNRVLGFKKGDFCYDVSPAVFYMIEITTATETRGISVATFKYLVGVAEDYLSTSSMIYASRTSFSLISLNFSRPIPHS